MIVMIVMMINIINIHKKMSDSDDNDVNCYFDHTKSWKIFNILVNKVTIINKKEITLNN